LAARVLQGQELPREEELELPSVGGGAYGGAGACSGAGGGGEGDGVRDPI
jgi:hypothetical protein